jgi:hypothetical protein
MPAFEYAELALPIPAAMRDAHRRAWRRLAEPGSWWSGAERVAIAAEVRAARSCALCRERKGSLSPGAIAGAHERASALPEPAVDAVHRITTDPGRLSRDWFERAIAGNLPDGAYVELVGIVSTVVNLDALHRALGVAPEPLPAPEPGEPSRARPATVEAGAWVPMLAPTAPEARALFGGRPVVPNVVRALSLVPDAVVQLKELSEVHYLTMDDVPDPRARGRVLSRPQMELVAGRVSALNQCFY